MDGILFLRHPKGKHRGEVLYSVVAHLPWYDGNAACGQGQTGQNIIRKPNPIKEICPACISKVRAAEPQWYPKDEDLAEVILLANTVLKGGSTE